MKNETNLKIRLLMAGSLAVLLFASGCAVGNQYGYKVEDIGLPLVGEPSSEKLGVGTNDNRYYIVSGNKPATFVGLQRGGFGNPFDVTTRSGKPFSVDVAFVLSGLLDKAGFSTSLKREYASSDAFVEALKAGGLNKGVFLEVREWKTDIYMNITLHYDLELSVLNNEGTVLAKSQQKGTETIGGGKLSQAANADSASLALSTKISFLFNDPQVKSVLK